MSLLDKLFDPNTDATKTKVSSATTAQNKLVHRLEESRLELED